MIIILIVIKFTPAASLVLDLTLILESQDAVRLETLSYQDLSHVNISILAQIQYQWSNCPKKFLF